MTDDYRELIQTLEKNFQKLPNFQNPFYNEHNSYKNQNFLYYQKSPPTISEMLYNGSNYIKTNLRNAETLEDGNLKTQQLGGFKPDDKIQTGINEFFYASHPDLTLHYYPVPDPDDPYFNEFSINY